MKRTSNHSLAPFSPGPGWPAPRGERRGSTLTEVLIAMMIMSIGIVGLMAIFPLSVQRTVKATQLTNSTDVRYNAETQIDLFPRMINNPVTFPFNVNAPNNPNYDPPLSQIGRASCRERV